MIHVGQAGYLKVYLKKKKKRKKKKKKKRDELRDYK